MLLWLISHETYFFFEKLGIFPTKSRSLHNSHNDRSQILWLICGFIVELIMWILRNEQQFAEVFWHCLKLIFLNKKKENKFFRTMRFYSVLSWQFKKKKFIFIVIFLHRLTFSSSDEFTLNLQNHHFKIVHH